MKIEVLAAKAREHGISLRDRLVAYLPRYAPHAARFPWLMNLRDALPGAAWVSEKIAGLSGKRKLPQWRTDWLRPEASPDPAADVILLGDTFNRYFEPENLRAARSVLERAGFTVAQATPKDGGQPLCCGRTFLSAGLVDEARVEMTRTIAALKPALERGAHVVGLEPSCLLTFRDEAPALLGDEWTMAHAERVLLFEEFVSLKRREGAFDLSLAPIDAPKALLHGHCHQKSHGVMGPVQETLSMVPELETHLIASSCCGMAGAFGYQAETADVSEAMGELTLFPAVRDAPEGAVFVADGTSCRHQIAFGTGAGAVHAAQLLLQSADRATEDR